MTLDDYFAARGWQPFAFQREVWDAYLRGESGLIHSPTGTGKTLAAWGGVLIEALRERADVPPEVIATPSPRKRRNAAVPQPLIPNSHPLTVLWITPLRALAADTAQSLLDPVQALGLNWTVETRTSDTPSSTRNRQRNRLPTALVTTPESLSVLLANDHAPTLFDHLRLIVCDEWHELLSTKRGTQTELCLARLRAFRSMSASADPHFLSPKSSALSPAFPQPSTPNPQPLSVWGVSATMGNLDEALRALLGTADVATGEVPQGRLVRGQMAKKIRIESVIPPKIERFPWAGHLGLRLLPQVVERIERAKSTIIFTNTRAQTELWFDALIDARPDWIGEIALHHGSLDPDLRRWVEDALKTGRLRCVVSTSSLDLGVDFAPVDQAIQIGSPKGVARLLQRAGRSGHQPGAESLVVCVPTHALELVEVAAVREALAAGHIEARVPLHKPLDVLTQHLVTAALGGGFEADAMYDEVRSAWSYRDLTPEEWRWALDFVTHGGESLDAYEQFHRVVERDGRYVVESRGAAQMHRMSIGTIMSDPLLTVQYIKGEKLGSVDESFAARLKPGDRFTLAGKTLEFVRLRDMTVWVRRAPNNRGIVPRWLGGSLPLSGDLTAAFRQQLEHARAGDFSTPEMQAVRPILELQAKWSAIPAPDDLLIERTETREGHHLFFYPFAGRLAHEGLAALFAYRLSRLQPITFTLAVNDYGFELLSPDLAPLEGALAAGLFEARALADDIAHSLNAAELARRQFREIARVSGLVLPSYPGGKKTARQLQTTSSLIYDVFQQYDPGNLLLEQARQEVLERQLDGARLAAALADMQNAHLLLIPTRRPTPFAFPLFVERLRQTLTSEKLEDRIRRMLGTLEREAERNV